MSIEIYSYFVLMGVAFSEVFFRKKA